MSDCVDPSRPDDGLSLVVVTFRRPAMLRECLRSVRVAAERWSGPAEIIVVENGECSDTAALMASEFPDFRHVRIAVNRGFTPALVSGIEAARHPWLATLNDDATLDARALEALGRVAGRTPEGWAFCAQMRFADRPQIINSAGLEIDRLGIATDRLLGRSASESERGPTEVFGVSAGAAMYRRETLERIGGFDPTFFGYLEDADVAWRARMHGLRSYYVPDAVVHHHHSATFRHGSPEKLRLVGRNRVRMLAKNAPLSQLVRWGWLMALYDLAYVAHSAVTTRSPAALTGRARGLREWRRYRAAGRAHRAPAALCPPAGLTGALRRHSAWQG